MHEDTAFYIKPYSYVLTTNLSLEAIEIDHSHCPDLIYNKNEDWGSSFRITAVAIKVIAHHTLW